MSNVMTDIQYEREGETKNEKNKIQLLEWILSCNYINKENNNQKRYSNKKIYLSLCTNKIMVYIKFQIPYY